MDYIQQVSALNDLSPLSVRAHLEKVLADPVFSDSDILKRFLSFIVKETLDGRSNQLKEYTIGVNVLHKPTNFKPQFDAIVRIHATRLRRALNRYYDGTGKEDTFRIFIPKGNYVPVFCDPGSLASAESNTLALIRSRRPSKKRHLSMVAAVLPFSYFGKDEVITPFAEGLASRLSSELGNMDLLSVIAYYPIRFFDKHSFFPMDIIQKTGAKYLFAGDIQYQGNRIRVNIQMIKADTCKQVWSHLYERSISLNNIFELQDGIVKDVITESEHFLRTKKTGAKKHLSIAVA